MAEKTRKLTITIMTKNKKKFSLTIRNKKMKTKFIILVVFFISVTSCARIGPDEELYMTRTPYTGKEIRIDGYYVTNDYMSKGENHYSNYIFFYSNGVAFSSFGIDSKIVDINEIIKQMENYKDRKDYWALFQITDSTIHKQGWYNTGSMGFIGEIQTYTVINKYYKIINDTTLLLEKGLMYNDTQYNSYNDYYHFKKFDNKPDSTNLFIK